MPIHVIRVGEWTFGIQDGVSGGQSQATFRISNEVMQAL